MSLIQLYEDNKIKSVKIRNKISIVFLGFLFIWTAGWAFSEYIAFVTLFAGGGAHFPRTFVFVWLILWTFGGLAMICYTLWYAFGFHYVELNKNEIIIEKHRVFYTKTVNINLKNIINITTPQIYYKEKNPFLSFWGARCIFIISKDEKYAFGFDLSNEDMRNIQDWIRF